jgi:hypothetical protein
MYCPKCSQQQLSEDLRYCSRCGFPLTGVALVLEHDGLIPQLAAKDAPGRRRKIMKESLVLTLTCWLLVVLGTATWDWGGTFESVAKVGSLIFFLLGLIGLLRFLYAFLFVNDGPATVDPAFPVTARRSALPAAQVSPLSDYPQRTNTREMIPRGSVTENTTRLLDEE